MGKRISLTILHTSDLHGAATGYDYLADLPRSGRGLTRTATLIRKLRAEAGNTLLFDTGDFLQGSPLSDRLAEGSSQTGRPHPMIAALNALGYDALSPGNHDFNFGARFLAAVLRDAAFPVVCANFRSRAQPSGARTPGAPPPGSHVFEPLVLLTRRLVDDSGSEHELTIGVTGALPPQTVEWDHHLAPDYIVDPIVESVHEQAQRARALGADLVVVLGHTGIEINHAPGPMENAIVELASLDEVDVVLGGHTHMIFPSPSAPDHPAIDAKAGLIHGKPVALAGFWGNHLGKIDLVLQPDQTGGWAVAQATSAVLPLAPSATGCEIPEDPALSAVLAQDHAETLAYIREPVGQTTRPLHSYFSLVAPEASVQIVAHAQTAFLADIVRGTTLAGLPILSAASPFKTGRRSGPRHYTHVPAGALSRRSLTDLYFYPNTFCAVRLNGAAVRLWLEHAVSLFSRIGPASPPDTPLLAEDFPGYKFEVITGLTYEVDVSAPALFDGQSRFSPGPGRIRNLRWNGGPVAPEQHFLLATNSYRVHGIGAALHFGNPENAPEIVFERPVPTRDILLSYIQRHSPLQPRIDPVWSFSPLGGASAVYHTAPEARDFMGDPYLPRMEAIGDTPDGFAAFRIIL